jgi:hypothetical protein
MRFVEAKCQAGTSIQDKGRRGAWILWRARKSINALFSEGIGGCALDGRYRLRISGTNE